jgi:predicted RNase H-like HicB family nuclease
MVATARETIQVFHSDAQGSLDFAITLTCTYSQEGDQWVGICDELGTSAFADTLDQARTETQEAVQLQLNEVERITDIRGYLADNEVPIRPVRQPEQAGFSVTVGSDLEYIGA